MASEKNNIAATAAESQNPAILGEEEVRVWVQEALQAELASSGLGWLVEAVEEWLEGAEMLGHGSEQAAAGLAALKAASLACGEGAWAATAAGLAEARGKLASSLVGRGQQAWELGEALAWCEQATHLASLSREGAEWAWWLPVSSELPQYGWWGSSLAALDAWNARCAELQNVEGELVAVPNDNNKYHTCLQ